MAVNLSFGQTIPIFSLYVRQIWKILLTLAISLCYLPLLIQVNFGHVVYVKGFFLLHVICPSKTLRILIYVLNRLYCIFMSFFFCFLYLSPYYSLNSFFDAISFKFISVDSCANVFVFRNFIIN